MVGSLGFRLPLKRLIAGFPAPIWDVVEEFPVSQGRINRSEDVDIGRILNHAVVIAGCQIDIGDDRVAGVSRIDFPEGDPDQLLVLAYIPEHPPFEGGRFDSGELDPCDLGFEPAREQQDRRRGP